MTHTGFWQMGGFAFYVWSSFGLAALVLVWNVLAPHLRHTAVLRELSAQDDIEDTANRSDGDGLRGARP